ncbi:hypothetical protein [Streptomyces griseofuscus]|uniref:hypothetical protein n=1 Tax=Streptomyces griseofuscus TaxID=146922 RepID=UPI00381BC8BD
MLLSLAHSVPQNTIWPAILTWSSPGFAALSGALLPMMKEQGARWGVNFKVWRSARVLKKLLARHDLTPERRTELESFLDEVNKHRAHDEITRIREAFARD